jgi:hypothetical protein
MPEARVMNRLDTVALLLERVAIHIVAVLLPESGGVLLDEPETD